MEHSYAAPVQLTHMDMAVEVAQFDHMLEMAQQDLDRKLLRVGQAQADHKIENGVPVAAHHTLVAYHIGPVNHTLNMYHFEHKLLAENPCSQTVVRTHSHHISLHCTQEDQSVVQVFESKELAVHS